jgi:hypothetical protein
VLLCPPSGIGKDIRLFPNPQDALPLPPRPTLEYYNKLAKDLAQACKSGQPEAIRGWADAWVHELVKLTGLNISNHLPVSVPRWIDLVSEFAQRHLSAGDAAARCSLAAAQYVIARSHGFENWLRFSENLEFLKNRNSPVSQFEAAVDAVITGDLHTLERLLLEDPKLARARSTREHRATLLHYVSANGVEGYRQKTPKNIVAITELLLASGADVNAEADVYSGAATPLALVATSIHPQHAGVQTALMEKLLAHGAVIGDTDVSDCLANGQPQAADFLAKRKRSG